MPRGRRRAGAKRTVGRRDPGPDFPPWLALLFARQIGRFTEERKTWMRLARNGDQFAIRLVWLRWRCRLIKG